MIMEDVCKIISSYSNTEADDITMDMNLAEDLDIDSLDAFEIMSEIEDRFDIQIDDEVLEKIVTVEDIVEYLEQFVEQ